jgi:ferrous iron transport protein A
VKLAECPVGATLRLVGDALDPRDGLRLRELGLREGCLICVEQRAGFGGRVVRCGAQRFALDAATAKALIVEVAVPAEVR